MDAKEYLENISKICDKYEKNEECLSKCPLKQYQCGIPQLKEEIAECIRVVKGYKEEN